MRFADKYISLQKLMAIIGTMFLLAAVPLQAQNAPVTTAATVPGALPGEITVPVTVTGFTNIGAVSLTLEYDYSVMHFLQSTPHPQLSSAAIGDTDPGTGMHRIIMGWYGNSTTLPDGSAIMTLTFNYIGGFTEMVWLDNGPSCEYADGIGNVLNDLPASSFYFNGYVCGYLGNPGPIEGLASLCQGTQGIGYRVDPLENATDYLWSVLPGATIISGQHTNAILVNYSLGAVSGNVSVQGANICETGPFSERWITVNELPVANAGNDTIIPYSASTTLHGSSDNPGTFSYHWSPEEMLVDPDVQDPQTVSLITTTLFTLWVTDQSEQCQSTDEVVVSIFGSPLICNPASVPGEICLGETAQLFANAGGGTGIYVYSWTCAPEDDPPWTSDQENPLVSPSEPKTYYLTVTDVYFSVSGSTQLAVDPLPSAVISGGDSLCGENETTDLTVDLTGIPPWSLYYSNGLTTWFVSDLWTTPYTIVAAEPGIYSLLSLDDAHCQGNLSGSAEVLVFPIPPAPVIEQYNNSLVTSAYYGNQWYKEGISVPGATGQVFQPAENGYYYDIVTLNGCSSEPSNEIYFVMIGDIQPSDNQLVIEPNPASDRITVRAERPLPGIEKLQLLTMLGTGTGICVPDPFSDGNQLIIDIQKLPSGIYFLVIDRGSRRQMQKIVIQ